jgi:uncharacterized protein YbjQ (UPF0145 family)
MLKRVLFASLIVMALSPMVHARDVGTTFKIQDVVNSSDYKDKIGSDIAFYFGDQPTPAVAQNFGEFITNKKTNRFGKSDERACEWVMLSALIQLRDRAVTEGGNAVIKVVSYYDKEEIPDKTEYECHTGAFVAGVALKGTVVKLAK